jgi:LAO/AO transport system kinase
LKPVTEGWQPPVLTASALNGDGIEAIWESVQEFVGKTKSSGIFEQRRKEQTMEWIYSTIENELKKRFYSNPNIRVALPAIKEKVMEGKLLPVEAVEELLNKYFNK